MDIDLTNLDTAIGVLSAMITPVVLISACGSLTISTSNRLNRAVDRSRTTSDRFTSLTEAQNQAAEGSPVGEEVTLVYGQLIAATQRTRLLHRALTSLYVALALFVATSVALGVVSLSGQDVGWVALLLGMGGAACLFYATTLLIAETRVARQAIVAEMDFILQSGRRHAPRELVEKQTIRSGFFRRRR